MLSLDSQEDNDFFCCKLKKNYGCMFNDLNVFSSFIRWVLSDGWQGWKTGVDVYLGEESVGRWNGLYHVWGFWAQWPDRYQCKYISI